MNSMNSIIRAVLASQTIITMLPSSPQVQIVYSQPGGIVQTLRTLPETAARQTLCIDSTTLDIKVAQEVASQVVQTGAKIVDAPVSGGVYILISWEGFPLMSVSQVSPARKPVPSLF